MDRYTNPNDQVQEAAYAVEGDGHAELRDDEAHLIEQLWGRVRLYFTLLLHQQILCYLLGQVNFIFQTSVPSRRRAERMRPDYTDA